MPTTQPRPAGGGVEFGRTVPKRPSPVPSATGKGVVPGTVRSVVDGGVISAGGSLVGVTGVGALEGGGTWVGETGREWVNLPRGSQVVPNREAERMGGAVVHIYNPVLREDQDVRLLAAQVAEELDRRRR